MYIVKWCVLQYTIMRPTISTIGIIAEHYDVLCENDHSVKSASLYLDIANSISLSYVHFGIGRL